MAVAHGLLRGGIIIVKFASEQRQPLAQVENLVEVVIRRATFDHEDLALRQVAGQARSEDAASGTTANNDVVEAGSGGGRESLGSHVDACKWFAYFSFGIEKGRVGFKSKNRELSLLQDTLSQSYTGGAVSKLTIDS